MADKKSLEDLRRDIDGIDDALHDLLSRRAAVTDAIARTKPHTKGRVPLALAMRPAREVEIMRRLASRHTGAPPLTTVIAVIREVLSASLAAQVPFTLHVFAGAPEFAELAHAHFGASTALTRHETAARVLHACADDADSLGVLPLAGSDSDLWWTRLAAAGSPGPRIVARLPFIHTDAKTPGALVIAAIEHEPTGDDTTFLLAELSPSLSRTRLIGQLKDAGITVRPIAVCPPGARGLAPMLLEADGFVAASDPRLGAFVKAAGESVHTIVPVGGYANPIAVKKSAAS